MTVDLGLGVSLRVTAEEAGIVLTASDIAGDAFDYGRTGGLIGNSFRYFKCLIFGYDFVPEAAKYIDESTVRSMIDEAADTFERQLTENFLTVSGGEFKCLSKARRE